MLSDIYTDSVDSDRNSVNMIRQIRAFTTKPFERLSASLRVFSAHPVTPTPKASVPATASDPNEVAVDYNENVRKNTILIKEEYSWI